MRKLFADSYVGDEFVEFNQFNNEPGPTVADDDPPTDISKYDTEYVATARPALTDKTEDYYGMWHVSKASAEHSVICQIGTFSLMSIYEIAVYMFVLRKQCHAITNTSYTAKVQKDICPVAQL